MLKNYWLSVWRNTELRISSWLNPIFSSSPFVITLLALVTALLLAFLATQPYSALAQGGGTIIHTSVGDFGATCGVLSNVSVSSANGGEIRLAASVEDYFDGSSVDSSRWLTGTVYDWYTVPPAVSGGILTLDSSYLRSQIGFNQNTSVRFFEARALQRINDNPAGWPDLGFYRELPPLAYGSGPYPNDSSLRIFVTRDTNTTFIRGRDGDGSAPLIDFDIPTLDLTQYHNFRIEWDASETRFYVDGVFRGTIPGVSTLNTWVFLYHQTPSTIYGVSPMQVDWVRAGVYPASGTYTSCVQDVGQVVSWTSLTPVVNQPASTSVAFSTRTSIDGINWTAWAETSGGTITSPAGRYLQYRATLGTSNVMTSPEVQQVSISYGSQTGPTNTPTATNTPAPPTNSPTPTNTPTNSPTPTNTPTNTPTFTPTFTPTPLPDLLFSDSFEAGNLVAWSASTTDGDDLSAASAAALIGANGLLAVLDNNTSIYVTDDTPQAEPRYRARFYFDPNTIAMSNGNAHFIFYGYSGTSTVATQVEFRRSGGAYQIRAALRNDGSTFTNTSWFTLSDAPHYIELDWRASTGAGANNGGLTLWLDGTQQANLTGIDNDTRRIDQVRLGAVAGVDSGTRGTYYFDAFESRRQSYIGPDSSTPPTSTPTNTPVPPTNTPTNTPVPATNTPTNTPIPPTNTPTNTPVPPTNTPTPTPGSAGNFALSFDGSNDIVRAGQIPNSGALTIETWVRPGANNANGLLILQGDDNNGWSLEMGNGQVYFWLATNQGWQVSLHNTVLQAGQWYHVAATYSSGTARVFVNGISSTAVSVGTLTQGPALQIGGLAGYPYFNGAIDEVRISNVVRYNANFTVPTSPYAVDANTVGLWRFNEGSGQVTADVSSSGNNGTLGTGSGADTADPTWVAGYPFSGQLGQLSTGVESQATNYSLRFYGHGVSAPDLDRVKIPIDPQVPADVSGNFTLEFWMKANQGDNNSGSCNPGNDNWITGNIMFDRDIFGGGDFGDYGISLHGRRIAFGVHNGSSGAGICNGTVNLDDGQWHHVAVTRNNSNGELRIFVDGVQRGQGSGPTGNISYRDGRPTGGNEDDPFLVIGAEKHDAGSQFPSYDGLIDEVRLSNIIRYTGNFTRPSAPFTSDGNTVALYHFDEGPAGDCPTNKVIVDSSGASGGPSNGFCRFGGSAPAGPVYMTDIPPFGLPDTTPPVITNIGAGALDTLAIITWTTDEPATSRVEYGEGSPSMSTTETTNYVTSHQVVLTGLNPQTTYVFRVYSRDVAGNLTSDPNGPGLHSFSTLAPEEVRKMYLPVILSNYSKGF